MRRWDEPDHLGLNKEKTDVAIKVTKGKKKIGKGDSGDMKELPPASEPGA